MDPAYLLPDSSIWSLRFIRLWRTRAKFRC